MVIDNAINLTCVIVILAYFTTGWIDAQQILVHQKRWFRMPQWSGNVDMHIYAKM